MDDETVRGILLRLRTFTHVMHDRVRQEAPPGLSMQHMLLLKTLIEAGPQPQGRLVEHLGVTKGAVSQAVGQLEAAGLVERRKDETDGRIQWVHPTAKADAKREQVEGRMTALFADLFDTWSDQDAQRFADLLDGLIERAKGSLAACDDA
ncbi:MAG: MarR family winged helix-turn-helix transcriptional regulator [Thermoplasmatota archaeon]